MFSRTLSQVLLVFAVLSGLAVNVTPARALGTPEIVGINPGSPAQVGSNVCIRARVSWDSDFRSMRIRFGNEGWQESGETEFERCFGTSHLGAGWYTIRVEVAKVNEGWESSTSTEAGFELTSPPGPSKGPSISEISLNPGNQTSGSNVNIHIRTSSVPGAVTVSVSCGGVSKNETSESDFDSTWRDTASCSGQETVTVCSRAQDDPNWQNSTCANKNYNFYEAQNAPAIPTINFWADSTSIGIGQCTNIRWQTNGSDRVDIDGSLVDKNGSMQVCPSVTKKYSLTAGNNSGNAYANIKVVVSTNPQQGLSDPSSSFSEGDVINIGGNIYVITISNGTRYRQWIPNPDSLDAMGISRSLVNNRGFSDEELRLISEGNDIPDVNVNPSGFEDFKADYFPNLPPIIAGQNDVVVPGQFDPHAPGVCTGWETRLWIGAYARITEPGHQLKLRAGPTVSESLISKMPSGYKFTVIGGPVCADDHTWWKIQGDAGTGWGAEQGDDNGKTYWWMAPMTDPPPPVSIQVTPEIEQAPETPAETDQGTQPEDLSNVCELMPKARINPGFRREHWFILEIPKSIGEPYEIFYREEPMSNDDNGVRHDGFIGESDDAIFLGIASRFALPRIDQIFRDSNWKIKYPC